MTMKSQPHRILVTGADGQVGWELRRRLSPLGGVIPVDQPQLDLNELEQVSAFVRELKPTIIVNAAARTDVDGVEA